MVKVKRLTQTTKQLMIKHGFSQAERLTDIYKTFHNSKWNIMNKARDVYHLMRGYDFKIIGKNSQTFSAGFYYKDNKEDIHFVYITRDEIYDCFVGGKENLIACATLVEDKAETINLVKEKNKKQMVTLDNFMDIELNSNKKEETVCDKERVL